MNWHKKRHPNPPTDEIEKEILEIEKRQLKIEEETLHVLREIERDLHPKRFSRFAAVRFTGDIIMADNVLVLNVGQTSTAAPITYLADGVTPSGATYSAVTYTFNDPSATVVLNPDGVTAVVTGVAASTGPVSGTVSFTATDSDSVVSQWTQTFTITTNAVAPPPAQLSQVAAVQFSTPV